MRSIIFLHGFFASGACAPAQAIKQSLSGQLEVLTPDLPLHPEKALNFIHELCEQAQPALLVGNSNGSFLAQMVASQRGLPALLGNPHFVMTEFLRSRMGAHSYKSQRQDGIQDFVIDESLIAEFASLQQQQWTFAQKQELIWGLFGQQDHVAHYEELFLEHYCHAFHFPGAHTPTAEEAATYYVPLIKQLLLKAEQRAQ